MKVAITIWDERVSPVLDTANHLLIVDFEGGKDMSRELIYIPHLNPFQRALFIKNLGIDMLVCGAVSHQLETLLRQSRIELIPWVKGNIDDIISACARDDLTDRSLYLPGFRGAMGKRGRGRRHGRQGRGRMKEFREEES